MMRESIRRGAVGGAVTIFLALVGLIGNFADLNLIGTEVTFGGLMIYLAPFIVGYSLTGSRVERGEQVRTTPREALVRGSIAGAFAGFVFSLAVVFADWFGIDRIRAIFINVSGDLFEAVTSSRPLGVVVIILVVVSALFGAVGGVYRVIPAGIRKPLGSAVAAVLLFGFLQRIIPIAFDQLAVELKGLATFLADITTDLRGLLYSKTTGGMTWVGAVVVAALAAGASVLKARKGEAMRNAIRGTRPAGAETPDEDVTAGSRITPLGIVLILLAIGFLILTPRIFGTVISEVLGTVMVFALLGLGLNIVVGYAGLLDLGYVFFFATGAYATALLTGATLNTFIGSSEPAVSAGLNFYVALPIVVLIAAGVGVLIGAPVLRLRGDYLALVTLGLGEIATVLLVSPWLEPLVGGPQGMRDITDAAIGGFGFRDPQHFYYLGLAFVILAAFVSWRLANSRVGRAWTALREDEQVADAMGVSTTSYKLLAFAMGGAIGSIGGALFAVKLGSLTPASFEVLISISVLGIVILGGMGSIPGVLVGALVLVGLPGLLREFEEYRLLVYGAALVGIMIMRPQGLIPNVRRSRELHEEDLEQDKWATDVAADEHTAPGISPLGEGAG